MNVAGCISAILWLFSSTYASSEEPAPADAPDALVEIVLEEGKPAVSDSKHLGQVRRSQKQWLRINSQQWRGTNLPEIEASSITVNGKAVGDAKECGDAKCHYLDLNLPVGSTTVAIDVVCGARCNGEFTVPIVDGSGTPEATETLDEPTPCEDGTYATRDAALAAAARSGANELRINYPNGRRRKIIAKKTGDYKARNSSYVIERADVAVVLMDEDGNVFGKTPRVDENDDIYVYVVGKGFKEEPRISKCEQPKPVRILSSGSLDPNIDLVTERLASPTTCPFRVYALAADECSGDDDLELEWRLNAEADGTGSSTTPVTKSVTKKIDVLPLYRLTVGVAAIFDFTRSTSYDARNIKGDTVPTIVADDKMDGLRAVAFVAVRFQRVDAVRIRKRFFQIVAPAVGISLRAPRDHVYLGLLAEPVPGLGLIGGYHLHREDTLASGYAVGDHISSGAVPTDKRWANAGLDLFVGVALDVLVFVRLGQALRR